MFNSSSAQFWGWYKEVPKEIQIPKLLPEGFAWPQQNCEKQKWTEEPSRLQFMVLQRARYDLATNHT